MYGASRDHDDKKTSDEEKDMTFRKGHEAMTVSNKCTI
jgi:hypothetical protein